MLIESNKYLSEKSLAPFSPPIDISSPSSLRHITYGSGKPLALHVNVTFVPSLTTISLLVIDSTITGGTEILGIFFQIYAVIKKGGKQLLILTDNLKITFSGSHGICVHLKFLNCKSGARKAAWEMRTWHMYQPRSDSSTSRMCRYQLRWSLWVRTILGFCVMTLWWMLRIVWVSTRTHAT